MRTIVEINEDVRIATRTNDAEALLRYATELDALDTPQAEASASGSRAVALSLRDDYPEALTHYHRALALHEELGDRSGVARVTGNIGNVHHNTGDYPEALSHYHRALALHEELGDRSNVAIVTGNIGLVHWRTGDYPEALSHYQRALALHEELGNRNGVASDTANIGNVHGSTGDNPSALSHYHRALALCKELGNHSGVARITGNILSAYVDMGSDADAQKFLATMDGLHIDEPSVRIYREQQRATLQERTGDLDGAAMTLQQALSEALEHGLRSQAADLHKAMRELGLKQNNLAGYVEHNSEYTRITEEINGKDTATKLAMQAKQREIDAERRETEKHMAVLHSTLPKHIADRIARGETVNDHYDNAAVIFLDIVGFTTISERIPSGHVVHLLEQIFTTLDAACEKHNVVKIKTIGDSYMAVSFRAFAGAQDDAVMNAATCALDMIASLGALVITMPPTLGDTSWTKDVGDIQVRIGIHCGPITAGVIGTQRMQYDVWGDTVNVASRMESMSEAGRIHVSEAFADALVGATNLSPKTHKSPTSHASPANNKNPLPAPFACVKRSTIEVKGKGTMQTYWLESTT